MSEFNTRYNFHDSKIRNIIIAVLAELQNKIFYNQYFENNEFRRIDVPFYYSLTGQEDFLTDYFMNDEYSKYSDSKIDGSINKVPRGVISLTSIDIDTGSLINRYVRTEIPKKVDENTFKMYSYETMIIPLNLSFDARVVCSSNIEMFKLTESMIETLYKVNVFYVDFGGYRVKGTLTVPENFTHEKAFEFSYTDKKQFDITFSIEISTSMLIFDEKTEMFIGNKMTGMELGIFNMKESPAPNNDIHSNTEGSVIPDKNKYKF